MELKDIERKIINNERVSFDDGVSLFNSTNLIGIGRLANLVREKKNKNNTYYIKNRHINYTNICVNKCKFCAFCKTSDASGAYTLSVEDVISVAKSCSEDVREFHIVGGLHPDLSFDYYVELIKSLKERWPHIYIKAFTAVEIFYFSKIANMSISEVLLSLKAVGLNSIPGGGAEIFGAGIRSQICEEKISGDEWLNVMKIAHGLGLKSTATMLYGHLETSEDRVAHLIRLRELQDQTNGFMAFIPLAFHPLNTNLESIQSPSGILDLKVIAISRIILDNFDHIKAYWVMMGKKIAQISLSFGADDIDGTIIEEKITHSAGASTEQSVSEYELIRLIKDAGRLPIERDTLYENVNDVAT